MSLAQSKFLNLQQVLNLIQDSMEKKKAFSMVRLGDAMNLVLAQEVIISTEELLKLAYVSQYNKRKDTGIIFPNLEARDLMLKSLRKATIVGIFPYNDDRIVASEWMKRPLTDKIIDIYQLRPALICDVCVNREMPAKLKFWQILKQKRLLIISGHAIKFGKMLQDKVYAPFEIQIAGEILLTDFSEIEKTINKVKDFAFDCVLLSAGVNANIIGPLIAEEYNTVVINFGNSMKFMIGNKTGLGKSPYYRKKPESSSYIYFKQ